ncbi:hypothetical protein HW450_03025 [Corynebacterium hindlerae]|uniref:Scaffolding protein n=1 Tax=Corynebacterium hindlerae TaxID=699041 RepID=A0A7G5FGI0_9CORY|nr:hypothetical protein [Corynebacterium hindlerae]QMV85721.1 hypothetical protein HW450_03025 [Corynebacterium hindlerae]
MDTNESTTNDHVAENTSEQDDGVNDKQHTPEQQDTFDREYVEKLRRENAKYRTKVKELEPQAAKLKEIEDASKTELDKALERIKTLETEASAAQSKALRADVAQSKGVPVSLLPDAGSKEDLEAAADQLLAWANKTPALPKVTGVGKDTSGMSRDELARSILGVGSN